VLAWSIVPTLAGKVLSALGEDAPIPPWPEQADLGLDLHAGRPIGPIGPLVAKLGVADVARLSQRFAGAEAGSP
jgi:methionyl-tRNA synthetase